jgi:hypothetical protein
MRHWLRTLALTLTLAPASAPAIIAAGCGQSLGTPAIHTAGGTTAGPQDGPAIPLPDNQGYAEVVLDRTGVIPGKAGGARINVYFLIQDLKSSFVPVPTDVTVKAVPPDGEPVNLKLKHEPAQGKEIDKSRFASPPGNFDYDELRGEATATVGGKPVTQPFAFR